MKPKSSFLFATWSFLSLYAVAGLCTAEPPLQDGVPSPDLAQHQAQQGRQLPSSLSHPPLRALAQDEALSPSGLASRSQLQQKPGPQHPNQNRSPVRRRFAASRRANTGICTFIAYQVQRCTPDSALENYLQINTLYEPDHTREEDLNDIRHQRPMNQYNSYQRILAGTPWEVTSLKDDSRTLTITETEEGDLRMSYGGAEWTEATRVEDYSGGWCEEAETYEGGEDWSCPHGGDWAQRKRKIHCGFLCARVERLELK